MSKKKDGNLDFESALGKLETIVNELENGELTLDDSLKKFEEGVVLYKDCRDYLEGAEKRIKILTDSLKEEVYHETEEE